MALEQAILAKINKLPVERQQKVFNYAERLQVEFTSKLSIAKPGESENKLNNNENNEILYIDDWEIERDEEDGEEDFVIYLSGV